MHWIIPNEVLKESLNKFTFDWPVLFLYLIGINDTNFLITFSYGRGLQASALKEFGKNQNDQDSIQKAFNHRAKMNGLSSRV